MQKGGRKTKKHPMIGDLELETLSGTAVARPLDIAVRNESRIHV